MGTIGGRMIDLLKLRFAVLEELAGSPGALFRRQALTLAAPAGLAGANAWLIARKRLKRRFSRTIAHAARYFVVNGEREIRDRIAVQAL
jgi:hypothetical protein